MDYSYTIVKMLVMAYYIGAFRKFLDYRLTNERFKTVEFMGQC